ncbi:MULTISPECIES: nitric oxide-sensing protein NosP [unclassified Neptuniibacter]|uniref:nitric oxide-sensing protein NosP n=1 Tax=unclassified Neptuniibacter TaxID=2630693 RepID=UPI0026E3B052|nr:MULTISPECIES: nitric oxide-sensing protein NosP [unclassified Neptuniibacter]MDO6514455.1 nitric oxide-sensing protein NosP [Neptuniibacter sp. 2_MG-2023]MDO6594477.1 nitric oxide-sensing protein NosP [Neptuniibacter sp. 1_MG-2023]
MTNTPAFITAASFSADPKEAAADLGQQLSGIDLKTVIFFCSAEYDLPLLAQSINQVFQNVDVSGCTTAGEITPLGYGQGCITAIGFSSTDFSIHTQSIECLDNFSLTDAQTLVDQLIAGCRKADVAPIKGNTFALTLLDGLSIQEENVLVTLNSALGSIPNFGGSAADDIHHYKTHVFYNGEFHTDAAVIMMVNTAYEFEVFSTHHMQHKDIKLVVTAADVDARCVYELNAEPAASVYADAIGLSVEELNHQVFALNPIAVKLGDEYYVRSIQQVTDDLSLKFYCAVENGIVLTIMDAKDLVVDLIQTLDSIEEKIGKPQLIIGCDCFLRRMECEIKGYSDEVSELLKKHNVIGFNTYGEQMEGLHINQTFTAVAIGRNRNE